VDPEELGRALRQDYAVEIPVTEFAGRFWLRVSIQGYNNREDVTRLVTAMQDLIG
jgi:selenocysteine lyase/cysteine desulfurase